MAGGVAQARMGLPARFGRWLSRNRFPVSIGVLLFTGSVGFLSDQIGWTSHAEAQETACAARTGAFLSTGDCLQLTWSRFLGVLEALWPTVLGGGIAGAVLKIVAMEGYFLDAVGNVMFGRHGIERMDDAARVRVWRDLTNAIYLPLPRDAAASGHVLAKPEFEERFSSAIDQVCDYEEDYLLQNVDRTIKIVWDEKAAGRILGILTWFDARVIPYDPAEEVQYKIKRRVSAGQTLPAYNPKDQIFVQRLGESVADFQQRIASGDTEKIEVKQVSSTETELFITLRRDRHDLLEGKYYTIVRRVELSLDLHEDNVYEMVPSVPIDGIRLTIRNQAEGVAVQLYELGWKEKLTAKNGGGRTLTPGQDGTYTGSDVFLPHQGCLLIFNRLPAA